MKPERYRIIVDIYEGVTSVEIECSQDFDLNAAPETLTADQQEAQEVLALILDREDAYIVNCSDGSAGLQ